MLKKNEPSRKEGYRVWWKCLKRSEKYKEWCQKSRDNQKGYTWQEQWISAHSTDRKPHPFHATYIFFGDVFSQSFNKWWSSLNAKRYDSIGLFCHIIESDFASAIDLFYSRNGRKPNLYEFQEEFKVWVKSNPWRIYLTVNLNRGQDLEGLMGEFTQILRKEIKKRAKHLKLIMTRFDNRLRVKEANHFLDVFDRAKKLEAKGDKWKEKLLNYYRAKTEKKLSDENLSEKEVDKLEQQRENLPRTLNRDIQNAREIIANAEEGFPPIRYGKSLKIRK